MLKKLMKVSEGLVITSRFGYRINQSNSHRIGSEAEEVLEGGQIQLGYTLPKSLDLGVAEDAGAENPVCSIIFRIYFSKKCFYVKNSSYFYTRYALNDTTEQDKTPIHINP